MDSVSKTIWPKCQRCFGTATKSRRQTPLFGWSRGTVRRNGRLVPLPHRLAECAEKRRVGHFVRRSLGISKRPYLGLTMVNSGTLLNKCSYSRRRIVSGSTQRTSDHRSLIRSGGVDTLNATPPKARCQLTCGASRSLPRARGAVFRTHFCPFPDELTYRMLSLTTVKGDVVLDPLAGIGSVPAMAAAMDRVGYGLELTSAYVQVYEHAARSAKDFLARLWRR